MTNTDVPRCRSKFVNMCYEIALKVWTSHSHYIFFPFYLVGSLVRTPQNKILIFLRLEIQIVSLFIFLIQDYGVRV